MKKFLLFIMLIGMVQFANGQTIRTVALDGSEDFTTIEAALAACVDGDTVRIMDSGSYTPVLPAGVLNQGAGGVILNSLTIDTDAGVAPTVDLGASNTIAFDAADASSTVTGPFVLKGASNTSRMTVINSAANHGLIGGLANPASAHDITVENANLVNNNGGMHVIWMGAGTMTMTNVALSGNSASHVFWLGHVSGANVIPCGPFTATNVSLAGLAPDSGAVGYKIAFSGVGPITFNDCEFGTPGPAVNVNGTYGVAASNMFYWNNTTANTTGGGTITMNNCTNVGNGNRWSDVDRTIYVAAAMWMSQANAKITPDNPLVLNMNSCTFTEMGNYGAQLGTGLKWNISGTPTAKCNIDALMNPDRNELRYGRMFMWGWGNPHPALGGADITLTDVTMLRPWAGTSWASGNIFQMWDYGPNINTIRFDRCFVRNVPTVGTGMMYVNVPAVAGASRTCIFEFVNSIFIGQNPAKTNTAIMWCGAGNTALINADHSTFVGDPDPERPAIFFNVGAGGFMTANSCIFDDRGSDNAGNPASVAGRLSMVCAGSGTYASNAPDDWIIGAADAEINPFLTAYDGSPDIASSDPLADPPIYPAARLPLRDPDTGDPIPSPAMGVATERGGEPYIDIDGILRPLTGRDLGASGMPVVAKATNWEEFK